MPCHPSRRRAWRPAATPAAAESSDANPIAIYTWRPAAFWTVVLALAAALVLLTTRMGAGLATQAPEDVHA